MWNERRREMACGEEYQTYLESSLPKCPALWKEIRQVWTIRCVFKIFIRLSIGPGMTFVFNVWIGLQSESQCKSCATCMRSLTRSFEQRRASHLSTNIETWSTASVTRIGLAVNVGTIDNKTISGRVGIVDHWAYGPIFVALHEESQRTKSDQESQNDRFDDLSESHSCSCRNSLRMCVHLCCRWWLRCRCYWPNRRSSCKSVSASIVSTREIWGGIRQDSQGRAMKPRPMPGMRGRELWRTSF